MRGDTPVEEPAESHSLIVHVNCAKSIATLPSDATGAELRTFVEVALILTTAHTIEVRSKRGKVERTHIVQGPLPRWRDSFSFRVPTTHTNAPTILKVSLYAVLAECDTSGAAIEELIGTAKFKFKGAWSSFAGQVVGGLTPLVRREKSRTYRYRMLDPSAQPQPQSAEGSFDSSAAASGKERETTASTSREQSEEGGGQRGNGNGNGKVKQIGALLDIAYEAVSRTEQRQRSEGAGAKAIATAVAVKERMLRAVHANTAATLRAEASSAAMRADALAKDLVQAKTELAEALTTRASEVAEANVAAVEAAQAAHAALRVELERVRNTESAREAESEAAAIRAAKVDAKLARAREELSRTARSCETQKERARKAEALLERSRKLAREEAAQKKVEAVEEHAREKDKAAAFNAAEEKAAAIEEATAVLAAAKKTAVIEAAAKAEVEADASARAFKAEADKAAALAAAIEAAAAFAVAEKAAAIEAAVKAKAKAETEVAELHVQHERALAASADALALVRGKWETAQLERATALRESEEATRAAAALLAVERHEHADARRQLDEALAALTSMNEVKAAAAKQHGKSTQHEKSATARHDAEMAASAAAAVLEADLERQEHALIDSVVELREDAGDVSTMRTAVTFPASTASRTTGTRSNATNGARMKTKAEGKQTAHASYPRPGVRERRLLSVRCRSRSKKRSSPAPSSKREPPREHEQSATDDGAKNEGDALTARTDQQKGEDEGNEITLGDSSSSDDFHLDSPSSSYDESLDDLSPRRDRPTHGTRESEEDDE